MIDEPCDLEFPSAFSIHIRADPSLPVGGHLAYRGNPPCMSFRGMTERNNMRGSNDAPPPPQPLPGHLHAYVTPICIIDLLKDAACHS